MLVAVAVAATVVQVRAVRAAAVRAVLETLHHKPHQVQPTPVLVEAVMVVLKPLYIQVLVGLVL
jgi:hypothetical protein